jgi:cytochrome c oxidase cbb3-type subunit III
MTNLGVIRLKLTSGAGASACQPAGGFGGAGASACQQLLAFLCLALPLAAQQRYLPTDVELGSRLYRSNCQACHGPEGASIPGVDFRRGQFKRVSSDDDLLRVIVTGVPGTAMPPTSVSDSNRLALLAYVRSLHDSAASAVGSGDVGRGRALFEGKGGCLMCHRVNGQGARTGPDLSEVGTIRTAAYLERSIRKPNEYVAPEYRSVRAVTRQGTVITGRRLNEDTHSLQVIDQDEHLRSLAKSDLREYTILTAASMPSFEGKFSSQELADLVTYLLSLKGMDSQ